MSQDNDGGGGDGGGRGDIALRYFCALAFYTLAASFCPCVSPYPWCVSALCYGVHAGLELMTLLPASASKCWDYQCAPPHPALIAILIVVWTDSLFSLPVFLFPAQYGQ